MNSKISRRQFIKTSVLATAGIWAGCSLRSVFDIIIRNGSIADGALTRTVSGDVGIIGDKIAAIGDLSNASAGLIIDATGKIVAPGFIDIHTHTDIELLVDSNAESKIHQGVTTEVSGNCGYAPFPLNDDEVASLDENYSTRYDLHVTWRDIDGFLDALEKKGISLNYATLSGHGTIRSHVIGKNNVQPSLADLEKMKMVLQEEMEKGSFGLSTGLEYAPGSFAQTSELIELSKVVSSLNGIYATHLRNEDDRVEEAVREALEICRQAEVAVQISHLKACNRKNWHKVDHLLEMIHSAHDNGMPVHADRYPYNAWSTGLSSLLPVEYRQGTTEEMLNRLSDQNDVKEIRKYAEKRAENIGGWDRFLISSCVTAENKIFEGKTIDEGSQLSGLTEFELVKKLLLEEKGRVNIIGFAMEEKNLHKILSSPLVMVGSDGSAVAPSGKLGSGKPHPRYYGTFPRVLGKYCREEQLFDIAVAVKKMTSMPAEKLGLKLRGKLLPDYYADVVVFDPKTVIDRATYLEPHRYPDGIEYVIVNGRLTIKEGSHTGKHAGKVLRRV